MTERGMPTPPAGRTIESVCLAQELCDDLVPEQQEVDLDDPALKDEDFQRKNSRRRQQQQQQQQPAPQP
jgi:hypothetical protein